MTRVCHQKAGTGFPEVLVFVLVVCSGLTASTGADWTQWGGPNGDFTVKAEGLLDKWPADGPRQLWKRSLGEGYSAILFKDGNLYTTYSTTDDEIIISLDASTGETN